MLEHCLREHPCLSIPAPPTLQMVDRLDADAIPAQVCGNSYAALHKVVAKALFRCALTGGSSSWADTDGLPRPSAPAWCRPFQQRWRASSCCAPWLAVVQGARGGQVEGRDHPGEVNQGVSLTLPVHAAALPCSCGAAALLPVVTQLCVTAHSRLRILRCFTELECSTSAGPGPLRHA